MASEMNVQEPHHIVIVGGGAAGLALASKLGRRHKRNKKIEITLIDNQFTHVWKPLLHEVAAGSFDPNVNALSYLSQAKRCGFRFRLGILSSIERAEKIVNLATHVTDDGDSIYPVRSIPYDTLVLAVGSVSNDFGVEGVAEHCLYLDSVEQANEFHRSLVKNYTRFFVAGDSSKNDPLKITIVGAGATGVELSAQLRQINDLLDSYVDVTGQRIELAVKIIEGADRVLPGLPEYLSAATADQLGKLDVSIFTNEQVLKVTEDHVVTKSGKKFESNITVWAAGIKAPVVLQNNDGLETNQLNQLLVKETLQTTRDDDIFALGDCASCKWTDEKQIPPRAQAAHQQATHLVKGLESHIRNDQLPAFKYKDYGSLVSLGEYSTVGSLMGNVIKSVRVEGMIARFVYLMLYKMHQTSLYGPVRTLLFSLSNIFRRSIHPVIKLH